MLRGINHITLAVSDVDTAVDFYTRLLGFTGHVIWDKGAYLSLPDLWLCLSLDTPKPSQDYTHIAFDIEQRDFDGFVKTLLSAGVKSWKQNTSEGDSMYILDPDGHKLEIHCGSLESRLESLRTKPYSGLKWL